MLTSQKQEFNLPLIQTFYKVIMYLMGLDCWRKVLHNDLNVKEYPLVQEKLLTKLTNQSPMSLPETLPIPKRVTLTHAFTFYLE